MKRLNLVNMPLRIASIMLLVVLITSGFTRLQTVLPVGDVPDNVKTLLADYSQHLNTGKTSHPSYYSSSMETLINNRRDYYTGFFNVAMNGNLISINSKFYSETAEVAVASTTLHIELVEIVDISGSRNISRAEDYPMIPAARWAIANTNNDNVKQALEQYISSTINAINDSISKGNEEVSFRVHHSIDIGLGGGQPQFIKDNFTDKEIDNGDGVDNVSWINAVPVRTIPDLTKMPGYTLYHTPIEVLGQQLLDDYTKSDGSTFPSAPASPTQITYGRTSASNYAQTYSSAATTTTCTGIYQDTTKYNQLAAYKSIWQYTGCNDCADFMSQALRQGNFPTDTNWNFTPSPGKYGWRVFDFATTPGLAYYLQTTLGVITVYSSESSLQLGDLIYDNPSNLHVVMVTKIDINGQYYSAHTNDRKNQPWSLATGLLQYWHIRNIIGG